MECVSVDIPIIDRLFWNVIHEEVYSSANTCIGAIVLHTWYIFFKKNTCIIHIYLVVAWSRDQTLAHCTLSNTTILITSQHQLTDAENLKFINDEERWVYINAIFKIKITPFLSEFDAVVQISGSCYAALLDTSSWRKKKQREGTG